jgi:hypothetical protein
MGQIRIDTKSYQNIDLARYHFRKTHNYFNVVISNMYYGVFQLIKHKLYNWYINNHRSTKEVDFFKHSDIKTRLKEYALDKQVAGYAPQIQTRVEDYLYSLRETRRVSDYHFTSPIIEHEEFRTLLVKSRFIIEVMNKIF